MEHLNFNYNVQLNTINCINDIDYTYHIINHDYPILHTHDDYYEFTIVLDGSILNIQNDKKDLLNKNTIIVSGPNDCHLLIHDNESEIKILNIIARSTAVNKLISELIPLEYRDFLNQIGSLELSSDIIHLICKNIDLVNAISSQDWQMTNSILKSTVNIIINYLFVKKINLSHLVSKDENFENKLNNLKTNSDFYQYNVNDLCYKLGYSRTHLNRIFNNLYNKSPLDYLVESKMKYAASLLTYTDYSIKEISIMIGYNSITRLTDNFKTYYGVTPSAYRKEKE